MVLPLVSWYILLLRCRKRSTRVQTLTSIGLVCETISNWPNTNGLKSDFQIPEHRILILINRNVSVFVDFQRLKFYWFFQYFFEHLSFCKLVDLKPDVFYWFQFCKTCWFSIGCFWIKILKFEFLTAGQCLSWFSRTHAKKGSMSTKGGSWHHQTPNWHLPYKKYANTQGSCPGQGDALDKRACWTGDPRAKPEAGCLPTPHGRS